MIVCDKCKKSDNVMYREISVGAINYLSGEYCASCREELNKLLDKVVKEFLK